MIVLAVSVMAACSTDRDPSELFAPADVGRVVVDAVLIVDEPLPGLFLSRTLSPGEPYTRERAALSDASVSITSSTSSSVYRESPTVPGFYTPAIASLVLPQEEYALTVVTAEGERVTAVTRTPPPFSVNDWVLLDDRGETIRRSLRTFDELGDSVYYAPENQLVYSDGLFEARITLNAAVPAYQVGLFSLDLDSDFVIDPEFLEDEDFEEFDRSVSSPAFTATDGRVRLPWFAIYFQERYKTKIYALDQNWYDLIRSTPEGGGGFGIGGEIGDNFERPIFNIHGGIGLFGSASVDSVGFFVLPRP